jgi:hypothetical protein
MLVLNGVLVLNMLKLEAVSPNNPIPAMTWRDPKAVPRSRVLTLEQAYLFRAPHCCLDLPHRVFEKLPLREFQFVIIRNICVTERKLVYRFVLLVDLLHTFLPLT